MSGPWRCERDDLEGVHVYDARDTPGFGLGGNDPDVFGDTNGHATELAAWEFGLECLVERRDLLAAGIQSARDEIRRLKRLEQRRRAKAG